MVIHSLCSLCLWTGTRQSKTVFTCFPFAVSHRLNARNGVPDILWWSAANPLHWISPPGRTMNLNQIWESGRTAIAPLTPLLSRICKLVLANLEFAAHVAFYPVENRPLLYRNTLFFIFLFRKNAHVGTNPASREAPYCENRGRDTCLPFSEDSAKFMGLGAWVREK